jgi:hypothetical protein
VRRVATIVAAFAVFAAGITTNSVSASARMGRGDHFSDHRDFGRFHNRGFDNSGGFGFSFGVVPYYQPYYEPYYQPYYQPYRVSHSCWRWIHKRHHKPHRVWVCGPRHY